MAFYTAYFDESGMESHRMFTFGGLVLDVENPLEFEHDWLDAIQPLKELHTAPLLAGTQEFEQWNNKGLLWKQEILTKAARVIAKYSLQTFSMTLDMDDFKAIKAQRQFDEFIAHPYSLCARWSVVQVGHWSGFNSIRGRVKMVFESRRKEDVVEVTKVFCRDRLNIPSFEDKSVLPLQAADLIATVWARKSMKKENFFQVKPVYQEFNQSLHVNDNVGRGSLERIWNMVEPMILECPAAQGEKPGIYFENDPKRRKPFIK